MQDWKLLFAVPLTLGTLALLVLVFQADANSSAQFFGAFFAAVIAALAALSGFFIQAQLARQDVANKEKDRRDEDALTIYAHLMFVQEKLRRALLYFENTSFSQAGSDPAPTI